MVGFCLSFNVAAASVQPDFVEANLTQEEKQYVQSHPLIKINALNAWYPFNFTENGKAAGYNNDLIRLVAEKVGFTADFVLGYQWNESLQQLENKEIDVISNIKSTPKLQENFIFTKNQSLASVDGLLTRSGDVFSNDLSGIKSIAIVKGYFYQELIENYYPDIKTTLTDSTEASVQLLISGKVDAVLDVYDVLNFHIQKFDTAKLVNTPLFDNPLFSYLPRFMSVHKDNKLLRDILDKGLLALNKKEWDDLRLKWSSVISFGKPNSENIYQDRMAVLSNQQQDYLNEHDALTVCVDPDWLPIEAIKNGQHIGIASEFVSLFAQRISSPIVLLKTSSWSETLAALKTGRCDFIPVIKNTPLRREYLSFTDPYLNFTLALVTSSKNQAYQLKDVLHEPLGVLSGGSYKEILSGLYPGANLHEYTYLNEGLDAVEKGEIYGFIDVLPVMVKQIQHFYPDLKIVDKFEPNYSFSIAVNKNNPILLAVLNKVAASISLQQKQEILNRWLPVVYEKNGNIYSYFLIVILITVVIFLLLLLMLEKRRGRALTVVNQQLHKIATIDYLTGLPNKSYFKEQFSKEWARIEDSGEKLSLLIIDIDNAKGFNEECGRAIGDQCFIELAHRLQKIVKSPPDLLCRFDEDEFIVLLPNTCEEGIKTLVAEIFYMVNGLGLAFKNSPSGNILSVSIGAACMTATNDQHNQDELKRRTKQALYQAQDKGYNQLVIYQSGKN